MITCIMRKSECLAMNPITVYSYGFLFNCTTIGHASGSVTTPTNRINDLFVPDPCLCLGPPWLNIELTLALTDCESSTFFFVK